ncbi:NnrS family protein [Arcobacter sp. LA11]|uniref:NnrS family protein n=1 Tax=Arcobacter sp. LA11 TaxID=1898176 RepID=UPI0009328AEF|nr:NnrS family protein [Arcobacter sp. LA11]
MFTTDQENVQTPNENGFQVWYKKFSSQPHQPFFTNGIIFFILFMGLLLGSYTNILTLENTVLDFHAYTMVFVVFIQFFLGFLFVVFPRFLMQAEIESKVYMKNFLFYFICSIGIFFSFLFSLNIHFLFIPILFVTQIFSFRLLYLIHKKSIMKDKNDTKWVLIFFSAGLVTHYLFILSLIDFSYAYQIKQIAINSGFYLFIFGIIFTISQRMIPFFTSMKVQGYVINKSKNLMEILFGLLVLKVIILSFGIVELNIIADVPLFILFVRELIKWKLPVFNTIAIMWVLFISLYWIPFAFFISILESLSAIFNTGIVFEKVVVHTIAVGYFITVLIGFGTRVVLGHSGQTPHADKFAISIFIAVQVIAFLRIFASLSSNINLDYIFFINLSSFLLIAGLLIWSSRYLIILLKGK